MDAIDLSLSFMPEQDVPNSFTVSQMAPYFFDLCSQQNDCRMLQYQQYTWLQYPAIVAMESDFFHTYWWNSVSVAFKID